MAWNISMSQEEFEAEICKRGKKADEIMGYRLSKYYDLYYPGKWEAIYQPLHEADLEHSKTNNYQGILDAYDVYLMKLEELVKEARVSISEGQMKRIHVLKGETKISEEDYRMLIHRISRKGSSKDMEYWEARLMIRALEKRKEQR